MDILICKSRIVFNVILCFKYIIGNIFLKIPYLLYDLQELDMRLLIFVMYIVLIESLKDFKNITLFRHHKDDLRIIFR